LAVAADEGDAGWGDAELAESGQGGIGEGLAEAEIELGDLRGGGGAPSAMRRISARSAEGSGRWCGEEFGWVGEIWARATSMASAEVPGHIDREERGFVGIWISF